MMLFERAALYSYELAQLGHVERVAALQRSAVFAAGRCLERVRIEWSRFMRSLEPLSKQAN